MESTDGNALRGSGPERGSTPRLSTKAPCPNCGRKPVLLVAHRWKGEYLCRVSSVGEQSPVEGKAAGSIPARGATDTTYEIGF